MVSDLKEKLCNLKVIFFLRYSNVCVYTHVHARVLKASASLSSKSTFSLLYTFLGEPLGRIPHLHLQNSYKGGSDYVGPKIYS